MRKAVESLVARGPVEIRRGKGTFVTDSRIQQQLTELSGFRGGQRWRAGPTSHRAGAGQADRQNPPTPWRNNWRCPSARRVYRIERVRLADGVPLSLDETYLPWRWAKKSSSTIWKPNPSSPCWKIIHEPAAGSKQLPARGHPLPTRVSRRPWTLPPGRTIFLIERTSYCAGPRPIDYEKRYYRGDLIQSLLPAAPPSARLIAGWPP